MIKQYIFSIIVVSIITLSYSCKEKNVFNNNLEWNELIFNKDNIEIYFNKETDSTFYIQTFEDYEHYKKYKEFEVNSGYVLFDSVQRDSLFYLAEQIVLKPVKSNQWVSCHAGHEITISLKSGSTKVSCNYIDVENWAGISPQLKQIKTIIATRLKGV